MQLRRIQFPESFVILVFCIAAKVDADLDSKFDEEQVTTSSNDTAYLNESETNESAYQCLGPSQDDVNLYHVLAWWMDGVVQVYFTFLIFILNHFHLFSLYLFFFYSFFLFLNCWHRLGWIFYRSLYSKINNFHRPQGFTSALPCHIGMRSTRSWLDFVKWDCIIMAIA